MPGYYNVPHKEAIHLITRIDTPPSPLTHSSINSWTNMMNQTSQDLISIFAESIFEISAPTLAHRADLPIAYGPHLGMIDVAFYSNHVSAAVSPPVGYSTAVSYTKYIYMNRNIIIAVGSKLCATLRSRTIFN